MLKLKDIPLGSTDAKNELLSSAPDEIDRFMSSFVAPPALTIERFLNRQKYYISGLKGTGKTALLRYISLKLEEEQDSTSSFVLFKSEVDEDLRSNFSRAARVQVVEENSENYDGDDYEAVWRWFIYRKISSVIQEQAAKPFQDNINLSSFLALVNSEALAKPDQRWLTKLVPNIKKGRVEISKSPKLALDLDWDNEGRAKVSFNELVRQADHAFQALQPSAGRLNIFFDELELSYSNNKKYQRDARLIRDLIVSVEGINAVIKKFGFPICLYAAVRSEVLGAVDSLGKEINKPMADFGLQILWNRPGLDATQQPLLSIIEQRINNARKESGLPVMESEKIWSDYFPGQIDNKRPQVYILHNSWYRPRDVVRLLLTVQDQYPDETSFHLQGLEAVRKAYSSASWGELTEELKAKYKSVEIDGIKYVFYGYRQISSLADLSMRAEMVAKERDETKVLLERNSMRNIIKDLFRAGVVGNINERRHLRFSFRGDDEVLFDQDIFVHNALRSHLSIT